MRRIYESEALHRDDEEQFTPNQRRSETPFQAMPSVNTTALSRRLLPNWLRNRAVSVSVSTPREEFPLGTTIPFRVTMANALPVPVTFRTRSPILWTWDIDGETKATRTQIREPPDEPGEFRFERGERKRFKRRWKQLFRVSASEWTPAEPGEYTIGAGLNVDNAVQRGLYDQTTVRVSDA
ncbi:hypothetical protein [Halocatena pleomorpha]|uniref:DUF7974 domain-containing protein n=1 Tax=Halocatena pleomorpha TaxID=1785090 RepID=A0A3P3R8H9_9EURY|nr:hypothetical protein [Halocatena pleomorpha]RRJ29685.1 hypothetical protein EIK79_12055 [Halocatena pleomorpha]